MSVKHKPLLHETVAAGMRSEVAASFFSYRRIPLNVTYSISVALHATYSANFDEMVHKPQVNLTVE